MGFQLADVLNNAPFFAVVLTGLASIVIESIRLRTPVITFAVSLAGLLLAGLLAINGLTLEDVSFGGMLSHGSYQNFFNLVFCLAAALTLLLAKPYLERFQHHRGDYYILILFATMGMMLMTSSLSR